MQLCCFCSEIWVGTLLDKRPMGLDALLENQLGHWQKFQKLHIHSLFTLGVEIKLILALRAAVSKIRADFQNCHIWV